jgi:hypothetical protein
MSSHQFRPVLQSFLQDDSLPFANVLSEETIDRIALEAGVPIDPPPLNDHGDSFNSDFKYTTSVTLWAFLSQILHEGTNRSCVAAVARVVTLCIALNRTPPSPDTGAYCRSRQRLPLVLVQRLTEHVADEAERRVPSTWLWKNRHVYLGDGTTVSAPDTPELQKAYPQPKSQRPGVGFPLIRMVVLLSLATGMVGGMAMGPNVGKETGETALLRQLFGRLKPGDVLLADRLYCSYFLIAQLKSQGVDCVTRMHQSRQYDFRRGRRLGTGDHVVTWIRPPRPSWMDAATYDAMPESLEMRELHVQIREPGFRVRSLVVVTTLTNEHTYTKEDIAELYHRRWLVELDLRSLKITLRMDVLRCKSPEMVEKEIWVCLLANNLIRQCLLQAALRAKLSPRQLSFAAAVQQISSNYTSVHLMNDCQRLAIIETSLQAMASHLVGDRPGRVEPRQVKRRPKPHALLNQPRAEARAVLLVTPE